MKWSVKSLLGAFIFRVDNLKTNLIGSYIKSRLLFCGKDVFLKKGVMIDYPSKVSIGKGTMIGQYSHLRGGGGIVVGEWCQISSFVNISTVNHNVNGEKYFNNVSYKGIRLGNNVWIGTNVTVLPGISIGDNSIIGAGAVVTKNIPANTIALGVPAEIKGKVPPLLEELGADI